MLRHLLSSSAKAHSPAMHLRSPHLRLVAFLLALPSCCLAGTSSPIDIGALIIWVGGYLLGFIVLVVGAVWSKWFRIALLVYIIVPAAWIAFEINAGYRRSAEAVASFAAGDKENEQAFTLYCKDRQRKVFATAPLESASRPGDRTVYLKFDSQFRAHQNHLNAGVMASYLQANPARCARTGLLALVGNYHGEYDKDKRDFKPEIRRYDACTKGDGEIVPAAKARYELVLGETVRNDAAPWGGAWLSRVSVRVVDHSDASTLAEDTLYFLSRDSGVGGCPKAEEQLAELLADVFGRPER
jgi:hypothetical protein